MKNDSVSRKLIVASLFIAFALGAVFAGMGLKLRPRVAVAPAPPPVTPPEPAVAASDAESSGKGNLDEESELVAEAIEEGEVAPVVDLEDGLPDSVAGDGSMDSPEGYPVKAEERSRLYHVPGSPAYERTVADLHFRTVEAAEAAGYAPSKA